MKWLFVVVSAALAWQAQAKEEKSLGWDNGNAGDTYAAEFIMTGRDVAERLKTLPASELVGIDLLALQGALTNTVVHTEDVLILNNFEVDAINYPEDSTRDYPDEGSIKVSRKRWKELRESGQTKNRLTLALHEYLFMAHVDDSQFRYSDRLIALMDISDYSPSKWWTPLNPANRISTNLQYSPNDCKLDGFSFDLAQSQEFLEKETTGNCGDGYRKVTVEKTSLTAPPSSKARGTFHHYEISVTDIRGQEIGRMSYEPTWGVCLLPQDGTCKLSGTFGVGGVDFIFWMLR